MPTNDYFDFSTGNFPKNSKAFSATMRALTSAVNAAFDLMPSRSLLTRGAVNSGTTAGSANTYTLAITAIDAYADLQRYTVKINATNTGGATLNVSGLGARTINRLDGSPLEAGDLIANRIYDLAYNATDSAFTLMTQMPDTVASSAPSFTSVTTTTSVTAPIVKTESAAVDISAGNYAFDLDIATVFRANVTADGTVTLSATDATKVHTFTVIATTTGAFTFTALAMTGVSIYRKLSTTISLQASGRTVLGCIYDGAAGTLDVFVVDMEPNT